MKNLVVYYSRSSNTETVAKEISKQVNGDLKKIELNKDISFFWAAMTAIMGLKGKVKTTDFNIKEYDNIFIGSPVWGGKTSTPINAFLSDNNFAGKNVFIFITQADNKTPNSVYDSIAARVSEKGGMVRDSFFVQKDMKNPITANQAAEPVSNWINKNRSYL